MSKITHDGLTRPGTGHFIAVPIWQQWVSNGYSWVDIWPKVLMLRSSIMAKNCGLDRLLFLCFWHLLQDEVIERYGLSSVSLSKFFVGPLPVFQSSSPVRCSPVRPKPLAVNGCLDLSTTSLDRGPPPVSDGDVIDLTEDDCEIVSIMIDADRHVDTSKHSATQTNHRRKPGQ